LANTQFVTVSISILALVVRFCSLGWNIYLEFRHLKERKVAMAQDYSKLNAQREVFWTALREAYNRFRMARPHAPETLDVLVAAAGVPGDHFPRHGRPLLSWPVESASRLGAEQRMLCEFASLIYPLRLDRQGNVTDRRLINQSQAISLHQARGAHAHFWYAFVPSMPMRYLCKQFACARSQIVVLCWLEIALVQWTQNKDEGKTPLSRLAQKLRPW
jgi:hypothetical protein